MRVRARASRLDRQFGIRLVAQARAEALKRAEQQEAMRLRTVQNAAVVPDQPHVLLSDTYYAYEDMYAVRRDKEGIMRAGYRVEEAWERVLRYAFAGLDISLPQETSTGRVDADAVMPSV